MTKALTLTVTLTLTPTSDPLSHTATCSGSLPAAANHQVQPGSCAPGKPPSTECLRQHRSPSASSLAPKEEENWIFGQRHPFDGRRSIQGIHSHSPDATTMPWYAATYNNPVTSTQTRGPPPVDPIDNRCQNSNRHFLTASSTASAAEENEGTLAGSHPQRAASKPNTRSHRVLH